MSKRPAVAIPPKVPPAKKTSSFKAMRAARSRKEARAARSIEAMRSAQTGKAMRSAQRGEAQRLAESIDAMRGAQSYAPPPCFYFNLCGRAAEIEKCGRTVCRICAAANLRGREYPLREPTRHPLYSTDNEAADSVDMDESISTRRRLLPSKLFPFD